MRKVLIADDEVKVGQLVKRLIQWDRLGLTCIGLVTDGQTAYEKILSESPDIVITDIRMPVLTGLEMIQKASEQGVKCHFIVVSGYKYFDYAQKALKYGVEDYLLKPIDEDELNRQLQKIVAEEEQREDKQQQVDQIEKKLEDSKYLRHKEFLRQILSQKQENIDAANTEFGLQLENKCFRGLTFKLDRDIDVAENTQQMQFVLRKIMQKAEDAFSACTIDLIAAVQSNHSVQVLLNYFQTEQENIDNRITDFFNELSDYLENFQHYRITVGVSSEVESFEQISTAIEMSKEAAASPIIHPYFEDMMKLSFQLFLWFVRIDLICQRYTDIIFTPGSVLRFKDLFQRSSKFSHITKWMQRQLLDFRLTTFFFQFNYMKCLLPACLTDRILQQRSTIADLLLSDSLCTM